MIRKLDTWQEWMESDRIIGTAFLHGWDEKKSEERFKAEASGEKSRTETAWGAFDDTGRMTSTIVTCPRRLTFDGAAVNCDEVHMVGSLPEARGGGSIRALMQEVLKDFKAKGDPISVLMPFSFAFYRKFGFELIGSYLKQKIEIGQFAPFHCDLTVFGTVAQDSFHIQQIRNDLCIHDHVFYDQDTSAFQSDFGICWLIRLLCGYERQGEEDRKDCTDIFLALNVD